MEEANTEHDSPHVAACIFPLLPPQLLSLSSCKQVVFQTVQRSKEKGAAKKTAGLQELRQSAEQGGPQNRDLACPQQQLT